MPTPPDLRIEHLPEQHRFQALVDGMRCVTDYRLSGGVMTITHTGVPVPLEGRGIAAQLTRAALDHARAQGYKVHPACSYARAYVQRHPQNRDLLV